MSLIGRRAEIGRVRDLLGAQGGKPRSLMLIGEAGAGKSGLLSEAAELARQSGARVLGARGEAAESRHPYALLHQLLYPLTPSLEELPDRERHTLETVLGVAAGDPPRQTPVGVAMLRLLTEVCRRRWCVLIVDDFQQVDPESRQVLIFVARRIGDVNVRVIVAGREPDDDWRDVQLPLLSLGPLSEPDAARLLDAQTRQPAARERLRLLRRARGNPSAIIEMAAAGDGERPRLTPWWGSMPAATQRLLLLAAADPELDDLATIMAAAGAGSDLGGWRPAEDAGLVTITDGRIAFTHPLIGVVLYRQATAQVRQRAHQDLAGALGQDPARCAWHLACASVGTDEGLAARLEDAATDAAWPDAARALQAAGDRSATPGSRARRYTGALTAADRAGDRLWVGELHSAITKMTDDPLLLGEAACGEGTALSLSSHQQESFRLVTAALRRLPTVRSPTGQALMSVLASVVFQWGCPEARRTLTSLMSREDDGPGRPGPSKEWRAIADLVAATADPVAVASPLPAQDRHPGLGKPLTGDAEATRLLAAGTAAWYADESDLCIHTYDRAFELLETRGGRGLRATCLIPLASALIDTGRWVRAEAVLREAADMATVHRLTRVRADAAALRAVLAALRGEDPPDLLWPSIRLRDNRATHAHLLRAAGLRADARGDHDEAFRQFHALWESPGGDPLHYRLSARSVVDLAMAARRTGHTGEAAAVLASVRTHAGARPTTMMSLLLHHAAALLEDSASAAESHFRLAVVNPAGEQWPHLRARARLDYAQWLRRRRRPSEARLLLAAAADTFDQLGARPLAGFAAAEMRASGRTFAPVGETSRHALESLTAQEQRIVRLAAQGLGNREIGEQLWLSPRTVGAHLYKVFPKLGVSKRHQLRDIVDGS
ncbi:LuxR family transcriptional regulator [Streptosporangium sp. 'caverna']|uniref:helix-turn-helix transcriptional regulator n=1 Tax=Streptosporangium sp. 'caverna' TaxID=2202249 RepID=UPI0013A6C584|nr:LuxR family transcriptional regulator [Streptosporangium sp. 'caverna']